MAYKSLKYNDYYHGDPVVERATARVCTFLMTAVASFAMALNTYLDEFRATRVAVVLVVLIASHLAWHARLVWRREFAIYAYFVGYMFVSLLWTRDTELAMNTMVPAMNCIFTMVLFGSLITFHYKPAVLAGALCGFAGGSALYTATQGFPFSYPQNFSYNAIAGMYLFGLFIALMYSCFKRSNAVLLAIAVVIMLHIVATTSIKTNLGIALGFFAAGIMYRRHYGRLLRRRSLILIALACGLGFAATTNDALLDAMSRGVTRVQVGIQVLQAREDVAGYSAFADRDYWKRVGLEGWKQNPVFGYGTEAFRDKFGITSHSTPIDLLYNFGLVGLILFYGIFASLAWRLLKLAGEQVSNLRSLILGGLVCYAFVTLSGTMHYNIFLAAFIGISATLLSAGSSALATTQIQSHRAES